MRIKKPYGSNIARVNRPKRITIRPTHSETMCEGDKDRVDKLLRDSTPPCQHSVITT